MSIVDPDIPSVNTPAPDDLLIVTTPCLRCGEPLPIGVSMDDGGNVLDVDSDFADLYAHAWTHEVRA